MNTVLMAGLALAVALGQAADGAPQVSDSLVDSRTSELASEIRCPVCRGVSVEESPSEFAREMKALIREKVVARESRDEIRRYFAERYGEWVLLDPERRGITLSLWVIPIGVLAVGAFALAVNINHWLERSPAREES